MNVIATNKRASFDYDILKTYEAGIELHGFEVRSIRMGRLNISGSYAILRNGELFLFNSDIPSSQPSNTPENYDPKRTRKLLLHKEEIKELIGKTSEKGLTLVPIRVYTKNRYIKVEIGLGRARQKTDKREKIRKKEAEKEIRRLR